MEIAQAGVLGIVQGIAEFLPISSDGHLILVPLLLGWDRFGLGFDVILHVGTLLATVLYFRDDLKQILLTFFGHAEDQRGEKHLVWMLLGTTAASVVVVLGLEPFIDGVELRPVEQQLLISGVGFVVTSIVLAICELISPDRVLYHRHRAADPDALDDTITIPFRKALLIGLAQGFAALPGISRSGMTIATGLALGMKRGEAARFSFLASIPIIVAALAKKSLDAAQGAVAMPSLPAVVTGVVVTTAVGYAAIAFLIPFVREHPLWWFSAYTAIAGILLVVTHVF